MSSRTSSPIPVVAALILREGLWLLAQRPANKHLGGKWEFPGGKVDAGERPEDALVREIREELGCDIDLLRPLEPYAFDYGTVHIRMIPFVAQVRRGSPEPKALEHADLRWLDAGSVASLDLAPADLPLVDALDNLARELSSAADAR